MSRTYPRSLGKILLHIGKNPSKARHGQMSVADSKNTWVFSGGAAPGIICSVYLTLSLETVFPALKLTQNYYVNMDIF